MMSDIKNWSNQDNILTYERLSNQTLSEYADLFGLESHCDLKQITNYIEKANSILEIGAGSGRVLDFVSKFNPHAKLYAIEYSSSLYQEVHKKFANKATILQQNVLEISIDKKFDLILWMWSGIANCTPDEQLIALKKLTSLLTDTGVLIFDTIALNQQDIPNTLQEGNACSFPTPYGNLYAHVLSKQEINNHLAQTKLSLQKTIEYKTTKNVDRILYVTELSHS